MILTFLLKSKFKAKIIKKRLNDLLKWLHVHPEGSTCNAEIPIFLCMVTFIRNRKIDKRKNISYRQNTNILLLNAFITEMTISRIQNNTKRQIDDIISFQWVKFSTKNRRYYPVENSKRAFRIECEYEGIWMKCGAAIDEAYSDALVVSGRLGHRHSLQHILQWRGRCHVII